MSHPAPCPFCGSDDTELVSPWTGQLITSLWRCRTCNTHFEGVREPIEPAEGLPPTARR